MNEKLDAGPILAQGHLSLEGSIKQIFKRIEKLGYELTLEIFKNGIKPVIQNEKLASYYKRRRSKESEITLNELKFKKSTWPSAVIASSPNVWQASKSLKSA